MTATPFQSPRHAVRSVDRRRFVVWLVVGALLGLAVSSYLTLTSYFLRAEASSAPDRAAFFASSIDDALTRLEHLPYVLSIDQKTIDALASGNTGSLNPVLFDVASRAGAEFVYLLDTNGKTIASSNYQDADSLVGNHYTFRPYFRDAVAGGAGRFFAVGVTTGRPGYFIAEPVKDNTGRVLGVVTVKIGFSDLSRTFSGNGELVLVTDAQNVVLASSEPALIYGTLAPLSDADRQSVIERRQFGDQELFPLDWQPEGPRRVNLFGTAYVWTQVGLDQENWTLHLLSEESDARRQAPLYVAGCLMTILLLTVAAAIYRAAQLRQALALSNADRLRLSREIEERQIAETKLATARSELARKEQLAALGQLSASITHELGQPISAMRNYVVAEEIAADATPNSLWPQLSSLVDRMQRIVDQLRLFGRTSASEPTVFLVHDTLKASIGLVQHTADDANIVLEHKADHNDIYVNGRPERFEQVIVNLLRNAIDAAEDSDDRRVTLEASARGDQCVISVSDTGPGLGDLDIQALREPFFSTKPSGKGMGLGLAISTQIIDEMGGVLTANNADTGGAVFAISLPWVSSSHE